MTRPVVDELEERRVVRRLAGLAEAVEPLRDDEVRAVLRGVVAGDVARRPRRRTRIGGALPGLAATAAAVLAIAVGIGHAERSGGDPANRGTTPELLSFPEGSALELLLSRADAERPA